MKKWQCVVCGLIYDEKDGWPDDGIAPGTLWQDVPEDWLCPDCGVGKMDFEMIEINYVKQREQGMSAPVVIIGTGLAVVDADRAEDAVQVDVMLTAGASTGRLTNIDAGSAKLELLTGRDKGGGKD